MSYISMAQAHPAVARILGLLFKIDRLRLTSRSRRDVESILVRQAAEELDHAFPWQKGHGRRTAIIAVALGRQVGLTPDELHHLKLASLLHDIGLLTLSPDLLLQSDRWEPEAYATMQCHPRIGAELLEPFDFLREAAVIIAHHHERWDGTGYPYGLRGSFIPVAARILAIADTYDAIKVPGATSGEFRDHVAYRIICVAAGTQFDPHLVQLTERCLKEADRCCPNPFGVSYRENHIFQQED